MRTRLDATRLATLIEYERPRAQAELRAARTGVAARDAAVGARLSQCEANSTVLQVRLTNPAPQRTNIATYQYRSDSPAFGGLSPRRRPARRRPRAGRARGGCRRRAAAGARGSRFAGGAAPLSRLLASSPLIPAYPRASAVPPFRRSTISMSPFRALVLRLYPRRSFVHAVRPLLRAAPRVLRGQLNQPRSHPCA